ncbi:MAG: hypothetical protein JW953_08470 [Anaerolineae bacterium]|nr:hypothetical protein [Anaerolineae bacterium]
MSSLANNSEQKVEVIIEAGWGVEIFIIDGQFSLVTQGLQHLKTSLSPGIYKIKFKAGTAVKEILQAVKPGQDTVHVPGPQLPIATSAPISRARAASSDHQQAAARLSRQVRQRLGQGSQLFLFARDLEPGRPENVAAGLSLLLPVGQELDLAEVAARSPEARWAGCTLQVEPGVYRLRLRAQNTGILEQSLVASPGWQTQVFLFRRNYGPAAPVRGADLAHASVLMAELGEGFTPDEMGLDYAELARSGLVNGRQVVSKQDLRYLLWEKFRNPMFGIYGGHLLLLAPEPDWELLATVVKNLRRLVGDHPDVTALALRLAAARGEALPEASFATPPMLRSSWQQVVQASAAIPGLAPAGSLSAQIADRLWGAGAWLVWEQPAEGEGLAQAAPKGEVNIADLVAQVAQTVPNRNAFETVLQEGRLTGLEESLLRYAFRAGQRRQTLGLETLGEERPAPARGAIDQGLTQTMGLPYSVLQTVAAGLGQKVAQLTQDGVITQGSVQIGGDRAVIGSRAGGHIITGSGNALNQARSAPASDLRVQLEKTEQAIKAHEELLGVMPDEEIEATLVQLRRRQADLEAQLAEGEGGVVTRDSLQIGGKGAVIGSSAGGHIITGDENRLTQVDDSEGED